LCYQHQIDTFDGLPGDEVEAMLDGNAIEFYGLDAENLTPIAARIAARIGPEKGTFNETHE